MPRDKAVLYRYMDEVPDCEVSGIYCGGLQPHHIRSVGAGGPNVGWNLIRLTKKLHIEVHQIGNKLFCKKYKVYKIKEVLKKIGQWTEKDEEEFGE